MATQENNSFSAVALYSLKNISWTSVGKISRGYNIVSKEEADKWITHKGVRIATPEEVANFYGIKK